MIKLIEKDGSTIFDVRVIPRASKTEIVGEYNEALKIKLAAPPVSGKANKELIKFLSKKFGISKSKIEIIAGQTFQNKKIKINA